MTNEHQRQTLGDLLRRSARRHPDKLAIRCGAVEWTYAQFDTVCSRLATGLAAQGVAVGDRVAVLARNSHAFAALRFAVARLGAVLVPINFMLNAEEARFILAHSGAQLLCVDAGLTALGRQASEATAVRTLVWLPSEDETLPEPGLVTFDQLQQQGGQPPERELNGAMLAQIVYTSGTESRPKGAMLTHDAVISEYVTCLVDAQVAESDIVLHALPLYHCAQLDVFLGPCVYVGATSVITSRPTPDNLLAMMASNGITSFFAPPTVWISLLRSAAFDGTDLSRLAKGYYGASIMPVAVLHEMQQRLPQVRLWNLYGQTEIAPVATVLKPEDQLRKAGSAGRPALNVETRVVDDEMRDVAVGEVGEIVHRSPQLLTGYYHDDERTRAAFEGGWFHSGDLATMDAQGYITVVDRKKDMIKSGGENVASREVEEAMYGIPGVSEVAVIGLPDPHWIEAVTAVVVAKPGHVLTEAGLLAACRERLAGFKVPKRVILTDALPKNPSGKLLKRELRQRYA
ncbi:acyl-CoA synthetase [Thermomonas sp.]|uniref:acyl-CoA synthetase n=1 Tax=Thermomonas sp. TaxID=1971895 RepID=UPI0035B46138